MHIFVQKVINMHLEDYKMTGLELKELYKRVKRQHKSVENFADYLGIGRTYMYDAFNMDQIPVDIDEAIDKYQELVQIKNKILRNVEQQPNSESNETSLGPTDELTKYALNLIKTAFEDHIKEIKLGSTDLRENNISLRKTNDELTNSHATYRMLVEKCIESGILTIDKTKKVRI